jgi:hypothetical protein
MLLGVKKTITARMEKRRGTDMTEESRAAGIGLD